MEDYIAGWLPTNQYSGLQETRKLYVSSFSP